MYGLLDFINACLNVIELSGSEDVILQARKDILTEIERLLIENHALRKINQPVGFSKN